jgi:hypothetical protein
MAEKQNDLAYFLNPKQMDSNEIEIPGFGPKRVSDFDPKKFRVNYLKVNLDDDATVAILEELETRALRDDGIYILSKDKFVFTDQYFLIVAYMEEDKIKAK